MNPLLKDIFAEAKIIIELAAEKNLTFATAESCTGGLIGGAITAISGSSAVFKGGITAYDNDVKIDLLRVQKDTLKAHGAVSEATATEMAKGAKDALNVDIALSVTGIAGPGGGGPDKAVGTVWIGLAAKDKTTAKLFNYGDIGRNRVRDHAVLDALKMLRATFG